MIAAAKLGAVSLCGVDKDEVAVEIAGKNLTLNRIALDRYRLIVGNLVADIDASFRFVVANIFTHVILDLLQDVKGVLEDGGILVCSGIILDNQHSVISELERIGFEIVDRQIKEEWVAIAGRLKAKG
jgi:ribosomal protein L11 methyltransferase